MWHFPVDHQFMVKPQGKIHPVYDPIIRDEADLVHISLDSYSGEVLPRDVRGREESVKIPDFIVVKATASLHHDRILLVVEVKRPDMPDASAMDQMTLYLSALAKKTTLDGVPLFDHMVGLLVLGRDVLFVSLTQGQQVQFSNPKRPYDITGDAVHTFLQEMVVNHW
jgi:hypothetical protein